MPSPDLPPGFDFTDPSKSVREYPNAWSPEKPLPDTWKKVDRVIEYWQSLGVDGFRCDMSHMVPPEMWSCGDAPILREKDILTSETANTPVKRIYLCVQMMYLENDLANYQQLYLGFIKELIEAVPSFRDQIELVSNLILSGNLYKALRELRPLIKREENLLSR